MGRVVSTDIREGNTVMAADGDSGTHDSRDERPACQDQDPCDASRFDLYKCRNGDIVIKRKGDSKGPGESTGYNIYSL